MSKKSKVSLPKSLKIGHHTIPIRKVPDVRIGNSLDYRGAYHEGLKIEMLEGSPTSALESECLLHECLHAVFNLQCMYLIDGDVNKKEETIVSNISMGLIKLFGDNPHLLDYFKKALK